MFIALQALFYPSVLSRGTTHILQLRLRHGALPLPSHKLFLQLTGHLDFIGAPHTQRHLRTRNSCNLHANVNVFDVQSGKQPAFDTSWHKAVHALLDVSQKMRF